MKQLFLCAAVYLAAFMPAFGAKQQDIADSSAVYGVAFYNLENLFDTINANGKFDLEFSPQGNRKWNSEKYNLKLNNLANAIAGMVSPLTPGGPAVIGIAEVENESVVADLVAAKPLAARGLKYVHHDSPDARGIDVALLYDPAQFEVTAVEPHRLFVESNPTFLTRDQLCVSGVLGKDTISVIVNHWPSRLGGQEQSEYLRVAAAQLSKSIADSIRKASPLRPIIIMGDLN
ncbi:MAG: endonuclease/exonuclease/phosphatase family protein, partial [Paramuribaculum sp.]|nr:endonuclease/exonuclease/phosphatase family protein [Paramuribaculum sp.]